MKVSNRLANPERFDADLDQTFLIDADPDLNFTKLEKH